MFTQAAIGKNFSMFFVYFRLACATINKFHFCQFGVFGLCHKFFVQYKRRRECGFSLAIRGYTVYSFCVVLLYNDRHF